MASTSLAHPARPEYTVPEATRARVARGLALYRERAGEIEPQGRGIYTVPGCRGGAYTVNLAVLGGEESCSCPDFRRHKTPCKHVFAATLFRAKIQRPAWKAQQAESVRRRRRTQAAVANLERMGA